MYIICIRLAILMSVLTRCFIKPVILIILLLILYVSKTCCTAVLLYVYICIQFFLFILFVAVLVSCYRGITFTLYYTFTLHYAEHIEIYCLLQFYFLAHISCHLFDTYICYHLFNILILYWYSYVLSLIWHTHLLWLIHLTWIWGDFFLN